MTKFGKYTLIVLALVIVGIQFARPERSNPPEDATLVMERTLTVTPEIAGILDRACKDCHTHRTVWPWYSNIAPFSWAIADHVKEGRKHLNLSVFGMLDESEQDEALEEMCKEVSKGWMPLREYKLLHPEANLTPQETEAFCAWTRQQRAQLSGGGTQ